MFDLTDMSGTVPVVITVITLTATAVSLDLIPFASGSRMSQETLHDMIRQLLINPKPMPPIAFCAGEPVPPAWITKSVAMLRHERQPELRVGAEVLNDTKAASVILMCEAIGDCPGQVSPDLHKVCDYNSNKVKDLQEVLFEMHFDERSVFP
ncbi:hypothetical protein quinque_002301 [Culex quinquefasciatus]